MCCVFSKFCNTFCLMKIFDVEINIYWFIYTNSIKSKEEYPTLLFVFFLLFSFAKNVCFGILFGFCKIKRENGSVHKLTLHLRLQTTRFRDESMTAFYHRSYTYRFITNCFQFAFHFKWIWATIFCFFVYLFLSNEWMTNAYIDALLIISVYIPDSRMSPLIVRRRNLDRYGRADDSINVVVAVLLFALSELVEHFHCLFLSPLMVAMGSTWWMPSINKIQISLWTSSLFGFKNKYLTCARHLFHFQSSLEWARPNLKISIKTFNSHE